MSTDEVGRRSALDMQSGFTLPGIYAANTQSIPREAWATDSSWLAIGPGMHGLGDFFFSPEDLTGQPIMPLSPSYVRGETYPPAYST